MSIWLWWAVVVGPTGLGALCVGAFAYGHRERVRVRAVVSVVRELGTGGHVRYRSADGQGQAATEWELLIPPSQAPAIPSSDSCGERGEPT